MSTKKKKIYFLFFLFLTIASIFILGWVKHPHWVDCLNKENNFNNCISCDLGNHFENNIYDYNYLKASNSIDKYLLENEYISSSGRLAYLQLFKDSLHFKIQSDSFHKKVDPSYLGSPDVLGYFFKCAEKDKSKNYFSSYLKNEQEKLFLSNNSKVELLSNLSDNQFERFETKLFFQILLYKDLNRIWIASPADTTSGE